MNNTKQCSPRGKSSNLDYWLDNFFNHTIGDVIGSDFVMNQASANIIELSDAYRIELAAPGLEKSDFEINVEKNKLSIAVKKTIEQEAEEGKYKRREFDFNAFKRSFQLSEDIDSNEINASYENGVLALLLPKKEQAKAAAKRSIEIS